MRVLGLSYQGGDRGLQTWAIPSDPVTGDQPDEGNQNFQLDDMTIVVRSSGYASFAGAKLIDMGLDIGTKCNISGILTKYDKNISARSSGSGRSRGVGLTGYDDEKGIGSNGPGSGADCCPGLC